MKSYRKELWFNVPQRRKIIRITEQVQQAIDESGIKEGVADEDRSLTVNAILLPEICAEFRGSSKILCAVLFT